jgi:hypothetical protein
VPRGRIVAHLHQPIGLALAVDIDDPRGEQIAADPEQHTLGRGFERRSPDASLPVQAGRAR